MSLKLLATTTIALYFIIVIRYFIIAGAFYWALWIRDPKKIKAKRLQKNKPDKKIILSEIRWSVLTSIIFAIPGAYIIEDFKLGGSKIYTDHNLFGGIPYIIFSIFLFLFIQDTYFYWTHRIMHHRKLFPFFHKVHHQSITPTPWAGFSFHYSESIVNALIIPALIYLIPIHFAALFFILIFMTICSVVNHTGYEIYPQSWINGFLGRHFITATHHNFHHTKFNYNYALYFRFWDKLMKTDTWG